MKELAVKIAETNGQIHVCELSALVLSKGPYGYGAHRVYFVDGAWRKWPMDTDIWEITRDEYIRLSEILEKEVA